MAFFVPAPVLPVIVAPRPQLGYWPIRGLAHPIRLLLAYTGLPYEDVRYSDGEAWAKDKETLGMDFPNLPYWIDGDFKLTQSGAILRHLAENAGLTGVTPAQRAHINMLEGVISDYRAAFGKLCYGTKEADFAAAKETFLTEKATPFVNAIEAYLARNGGPFLAGLTPTLPDFLAYEQLDYLRKLYPNEGGPFANQPRTQILLNAFESIPSLAAYIASDAHAGVPLNGFTAVFR